MTWNSYDDINSVFAEDQEQYEYKVWVDDGYFHQAYLDGTCNNTKDCKNKAIYSMFFDDEFTENCACEEHKSKNMYQSGVNLRPFISNTLKPFI